MRELEKILEEIEVYKKVAYENKEIDRLTAFQICQEIIRKHMNDGWIPVKERLPEESGDYIVFLKTDAYLIVHYSAEYKLFNVNDEDDKAYALTDVIAWGHLSDPYKERSDNHDGE